MATDKQIKTAVLDVLKEEEDTRSLKIKKLRKKVFKYLVEQGNSNDNSNDKWESKFESILQEMELGKKITIENEIVTKLSKKRSYDDNKDHSRDNGSNYRDHSEDNQNDKAVKYETDDNAYNSHNYNKYMPTVKPIEDVKFDINELWKNGEQVYKQELLSYEYLTQNPDNITRLFVGKFLHAYAHCVISCIPSQQNSPYIYIYEGNLNRKITENQLVNAIDGITHIKWITDKLTQEFYGSTFVEMKDSQAAVNAVMMDKQKLMGRYYKCTYVYIYV